MPHLDKLFQDNEKLGSALFEVAQASACRIPQSNLLLEQAEACATSNKALPKVRFNEQRRRRRRRRVLVCDTW